MWNNPILACGNCVTISPREGMLLLLLAASWIAAFGLFFVNLGFIFSRRRQALFRLIHVLILMFYVGLTILLFDLSKFIDNDRVDVVGITLAITIPVMVISHFIYLLIDRRRFKYGAKRDT